MEWYIRTTKGHLACYYRVLCSREQAVELGRTLRAQDGAEAYCVARYPYSEYTGEYMVVRAQSTRPVRPGEEAGMMMMHEISGHNFHGSYSLRLRGPAEGFVLSDGQARRYRRELCSNLDCQCGGGYGDGPGRTSAWIGFCRDMVDYRSARAPEHLWVACRRAAANYDALVLLPAPE